MKNFELYLFIFIFLLFINISPYQVFSQCPPPSDRLQPLFDICDRVQNDGRGKESYIKFILHGYLMNNRYNV